MNQETKICQNCKKEFKIEPEDFNFYEKIKVPAPTWCPECRLIRRLMSRNERFLYKRKCDLCEKEKILSCSSNVNYSVYCFPCWWSDKWDAMKYGFDYDFSKTFFEQFTELFLKTPRMGIIQQGTNVNSEYTNRASDNRNCYLIFSAAGNENSYYGTSYWSSKDIMDCYGIHKSERCYECIDCFNSNNLKYSQECNSCMDSSFLFNCRNCNSCFGCVNLRNKDYCIFNKQYTKEDYKKKMEDFRFDSFSIKGYKDRLNDLKNKNIVPSIVQFHGVDVSGNWIEESKSIKSSFNCNNVENGKYLVEINGAKDVMDYLYWGMSSELIYEATGVGRQCSLVFFSKESWDQLIKAQYCMNCHNSSNLFGCIGLRNKEYCILNKQYTKEKYEEMVSKIIEHMNSMPYIGKNNRRYKYGEFFPVELSPFSYNETTAQEFFPLTKEQASDQGYNWKDPEERDIKTSIKSEDLPDNIKDVDDSIVGQVIECQHKGECSEQCTSAFRIVPQELEFYRKMNLPLPKLCPNCRHFQRLKQRNPLKLWKRRCMCGTNTAYKNTIEHFHKDKPCPNEFETSYAPDRPEIVYCEECYKREVN